MMAHIPLFPFHWLRVAMLARGSVLALAMLTTACSQRGITDPSEAANLAITGLAITRTTTATGFVYVATFVLREMSGRTGLQLTSMSVSLAGAGAASGGFSISTRAGDVMAPGYFEPWTLTSLARADIYTSGSVSVGYTDDRGGYGIVTAASSVSATPAAAVP